MGKTYQFDPNHYFAIPLALLKPELGIPFPLLVYLKRTNHFFLRFGANRLTSPDPLIRYQLSGIKSLWCPQEYFPTFEEYLKGVESTAAGRKKILSTMAKSEEGGSKVDIFMAENLNRDEKSRVLIEVGKKVVSTLAQLESGNEEQMTQALGRCGEITNQMIRLALHSHKTSTNYEMVRKISEMNLEHSAAVALFSMFFCLTLGYSHRDILTEVGMGAVLHDVGMTQINPSILRIPVIQCNRTQLSELQSHVKKGMDLLKKAGLRPPKPVLEIISQHHEFADGSGFPGKLKGSEVNELAQIVGISDYLHKLISGKWDGIERSPSDAFRTLGSMIQPEGSEHPFEYELVLTILQSIEKETGRNLQIAA